MEPCRAAAAKGAPGNSKIQGGSSQNGSRNARLDQENVQAPSNQRDQPTVEMRKRQEQQRQLEQERLRRQPQPELQQQAAQPQAGPPLLLPRAGPPPGPAARA